MEKTLAMVRAFRAADPATPIVLMGYYNPIYVYPVDRFVADAVEAGVDGLIVVDMPPEEDAELRPAATAAGLNFIRLATPTTDAQAAAGRARQYQSGSSITSRSRASPARRRRTWPRSEAHVGRIKAHTDLPIAVGFGVKTEEQVSAHRRASPKAWWSARRWSRPSPKASMQNGNATRATKPQVLGLVERLAAALRHPAEAAAL